MLQKTSLSKKILKRETEIETKSIVDFFVLILAAEVSRNDETSSSHLRIGVTFELPAKTHTFLDLMPIYSTKRARYVL